MTANSQKSTNADRILIDLNFQNTPEAIATWLVRGTNGWVMIDCGPGTSQATLETQVAEAGIDMRDVSRIVLTHIHLDHGGATGTLLRDHPHLRVTVHQDAAQVLIDPSRLLRSAGRSFGDRMDQLWGEVIGVDLDRIDPILPGEIVTGTQLWAVATPGHAGTHLSYLNLNDGVLFAGDATHARLPVSNVIIPTLAPIELDFDAWQSTAVKLRGLNPTALALPHFGWVEDADSHLAQIEERILDRIHIAERVVTSLNNVHELTDAIRRRSREEYHADDRQPEERLASMELAMPSLLGAQGLLRWYKVHGLLLDRPKTRGNS